jgi:hypothetical protein
MTRKANKALSIKTAANQARRLLGAKASPSEVGKLGAMLQAISRTQGTPDERAVASLRAIEALGLSR